MMKLHDVFPSILKNTIELNFLEISDIPKGTSKFGGHPDLPGNFEWYYYRGKGMDDSIKNRPLSFLAQINCQEIRRFDTEHLLPDSGMLYFFYELDSMTWGFDVKDAGSARVFYYNGDIAELERTEPPADLAREFRLPELKIDFSHRHDLPSYEEFGADFEYEDFGEEEMAGYWEAREEYVATEADTDNISKLLGYGDVIQGEMRLECEEIANGIYCGFHQEISLEKRKKMDLDCKRWQLLFQLDTVQCGDFELMFGDCGRIYYYICKDDLENRNFDNCWLLLQCY